MIKIDKLTADPSQQYTLISDSGQSIPFVLRYLPRQQQWVFGVAYGNLTLQGAILTCSPNIMRQYKNIIPFGISVISNDALDPCFIDDFTTGRISIYLLDAAEVEGIEFAYQAAE